MGQHCARLLSILTFASVLAIAADGVAQSDPGLQESNVLVLFNSRNDESQAVRDMYVARRPNVREFDLDDNVVDNNSVNRANYVSRIVEPLRDFINGDVPPFEDISGEVMAIVTTRGLPGIIRRFETNDEFQVNSTWTALESELALLQQNLEQAGSPPLDFLFSGAIDNPYHTAVGQPITSFSRANVQSPATFNQINFAPGIATWQSPDLTPGDIYLVTRLDAVTTGEGTTGQITALEHIEMLLDRSSSPAFSICGVQSLLDEYDSPGNELDDDGLGTVYPASPDFENTTSLLTNAGFDVLHDQTTNFVTGSELPDDRPVLVLGTYGENHNLEGRGDPAPGNATYIETYNLHPASIFISYESFNGTSIWNPDNNRTNIQEQVLDFITQGGSFTIGHVREPFTFAVADLEYLTRNMMIEGLTFAEAAYASIPALSWMNVPVGDPLARMEVVDPDDPDRDGDGDVDIEDLYAHSVQPVDLNCDASIDAEDTRAMQNAVRADEIADVTRR